MMRRRFNVQSDQFTLVTGRKDRLRFGVPHPGIPRSCKQCSRDVMEHQVYHLVPHTLCKYCHQVLRTLDKGFKKPVTTMSAQKDASEWVQFSEEITCAICYKTFDTEAIRKKHEKLAHGTKLHCALCGLAYSTAKGLNQHTQLKHHSPSNGKDESSEVVQMKSSKNAVAVSKLLPV